VIGSPALLIKLCVASFVCVSVGSVTILQMQARQEQVRLRIARVLGPHQRRGVRVAPTPSSGVGFAATAEGVVPKLTGLFGFDPALQGHYVLPWWVALTATFVVAVVAAKLGSGLVGPPGWVVLPVAWVMLSRSFFNWCTRRRHTKLFEQFPDGLAMIVRAVRVGIPVTDSIHAVGRELEAPTGPEFSRLSDELSMGVLLQDALRAMAERNGLQEYRFFATALALQSQTGGGLSETLENLADVIRKRVAARQKGQALSAEAKMSAMVLGALPPFAGAALWVMNSEYIVMLFTDPFGQKILAGAVLMLGLGVLSMRTMIQKSLS